MINKIHGRSENCWRYSREYGIYFLHIDFVLVRCAHSWDIDFTREDKFNVFAHLRIILFFCLRYSLDPGKTMMTPYVQFSSLWTIFIIILILHFSRFLPPPYQHFLSQIFPNSCRQVALSPWIKIEETTFVIPWWCVVSAIFFLQNVLK